MTPPSRGEETRERYRKAASSRARSTPTQPAPEPAAPPPSQRTRMTLDLSPDQRRALARVTAQVGLEIDRPQLSSVELLRAVITALDNTEDSQVRAAIITQLTHTP